MPFLRTKVAGWSTAAVTSLRWPLVGGCGGLAVAVALFAWAKWPSPGQRAIDRASAAWQPGARALEEAPRGDPLSRGKPDAMGDVGTYAAKRLQEIKRDPATWANAETWRREFAAADSAELQREVLGLAKQIGSEEFLAVLSQALASPDRFVRLDAARSLAFLHEHELVIGVTIAIAATDSEVRAEVMDVIEQMTGSRQPQLLRETLASPYLDVLKRSVELLAERPSPASFAVLIDGLRPSEPATRAIINEAIEGIVDHHFDNHAQATRWWAANRDRFDEMMLLTK